MLTLRRLLVAPVVIAGVILVERPRPATIETFPVPEGPTVQLDGKLSPGEWDAAAHYRIGVDGEVLLQHDRANVYVAVRGSAKPLSHICVAGPRGVRVLHASASLGDVAYALDSVGARQTPPFAWALKDGSADAQSSAARSAFLSEHGWAGTTASLGDSPATEFAIQRSLATGPEATVAIGAVWPQQGLAVSTWPPHPADDCANRTLLFGTAPSSGRFNVATWATLDLR